LAIPEQLVCALSAISGYPHAVGRRGFIYVVDGSADIDGVTITSGQAALAEGQSVAAISSSAGTRLMWRFGKPHHEPLHQHGPFED